MNARRSALLPCLAEGLCLLAAMAVAETKTIFDSDAVKHVGETVSVRGLVAGVYTSKSNTTFINFGQDSHVKERTRPRASADGCAQGSHRAPLAGARTAISPFVFHESGVPVGDFRKAWASACKSAKVPGSLFHDLRRTAVRNMIRAGVPQTVAMSISGHRTIAMFNRYNIASQDDKREALLRTEAHLAALP